MCCYRKSIVTKCKKYKRGGVIASSLLCGLFNFGTTNCQYENVATAYSGWYVSAGASYQYTEGNIILDDNIDSLMALGPGVTISSHGIDLAKTRVGKLGGSLAAGYGSFIYNNYYLGGEISLDITGSKSTTSGNVRIFATNGVENCVYGATTVKTRGLVPTVALRFGRYISNIDSLLYARLGLAFLNNKFDNESMPNQGFGSQRVTPIIGLGIEKKVFDTCSVKFEGDYRFSISKKKSGFWKFDDDGGGNLDTTNIIPNYDASIRNKVSGYVVRVVCVYHF